MASEFQAVTEGRASLLYPRNEPERVFYNPIQQFNRDLSVVALRAWTDTYIGETKRKKRPQEGERFVRVHEGLAASGLRSCRYALEVPLVKTVVANDLSSAAAAAIRRNAVHNNVQDIVQAHEGDANAFLLANKSPAPHAIDLDPYGGAAPFLDAAVQAVADGGMLMITCTDLAVLAGNAYPEKCFSQYGGTPARNSAVHESALRLLLNTVASCAGRYGRAIEPLLSLSIDYYIRVFVRVRASPMLVKENIGKSMVVYVCPGCQSTHTQALGTASPPTNGKGGLRTGWAKGPPVGPRCEECGSPFHVAGPMWSAELHSPKFIEAMQSLLPSLDPAVYATKARIEGMLFLAYHELPNAPFYYNPNQLASTVRTVVPPIRRFLSALLNGGYQASLTHAKPGCVKTTAPPDFVWDIFRVWAAQNRAPSKKMPDSPGGRLLSKPPKHEVSFAPHPEAGKLEDVRKSRLVRFQMNPRADWGPMSKPGANSTSYQEPLPPPKRAKPNLPDGSSAEPDIKDSNGSCACQTAKSEESIQEYEGDNKTTAVSSVAPEKSTEEDANTDQQAVPR